MKEVFFLFFFLGNNINTSYKKVLAITLSLFIIVPKTSLIILVLLTGLMDRRLLLPTKCVNKTSLSKLIFSRVLILYFG